MVIGIDIRLIGKKRTGDEVVVFNLVKNLAQLETDHQFKLFTDVTDKQAIREISHDLEIEENGNFEIVQLQAKNKFVWNFWTIQKYLRKNPVDIFHTQYITPWFVPKKIRIVTIIHDISFRSLSLADFWWPPIDPLLMRMLIPGSLFRADKVIAVSEFTKNEIIKWYQVPAEKIEVVRNALSDDFVKTVEISDAERERIKKKYNLPEKYILYVGTLQPRKNIPSLIQAFYESNLAKEGFQLVLAGKRYGNNYDWRIDDAIKKELTVCDGNSCHLDESRTSSVIFPGFIDEKDKAKIFKLAHVFAFPSRYEGFGIPPLEAMSQGVPVICSNIPSLKEIAGEDAVYFELSSLDDFSKKLYDICMNNELRQELIGKGEARVSLFSWQKSAEKMLAIYEKISHNE